MTEHAVVMVSAQCKNRVFKGAMVVGIREQNRAQTLLDIQRATLDLVEEHGLNATTVGQIAARAGISERTFFRYYPSKEHAFLPGQQDLLEGLVARKILATDMSGTLRELLSVCRTVFIKEVSHHEFRRISRLMFQEPELVGVVSRLERDLVSDLSAALDEGSPLTSMQSMLVAEVATTVWRVAWQCFGRNEFDGIKSDPVEVFDQTVREIENL